MQVVANTRLTLKNDWIEEGSLHLDCKWKKLKSKILLFVKRHVLVQREWQTYSLYVNFAKKNSSCFSLCWESSVIFETFSCNYFLHFIISLIIISIKIRKQLWVGLNENWTQSLDYCLFKLKKSQIMKLNLYQPIYWTVFGLIASGFDKLGKYCRLTQMQHENSARENICSSVECNKIKYIDEVCES